MIRIVEDTYGLALADAEWGLSRLASEVLLG